jgi:multiple sugar transport system substrate-binding protein
MAPVKLRGMTWEHRRAVDPLLGTRDMFRARHPDIEIEWHSRPLSGFEFTPVDELAQNYDLIILDHPFMGKVARTGCLVPLDEALDLTVDPFAGPSLATYEMDGRHWALPVDAACQVSVSRPDLLSRFDPVPPATWAQLLELGRRAKAQGLSLAIGLKGVHSLMTFFTLMANLGTPCGVRQEDPFCDRSAAKEALGLIKALLAYCPTEAFHWNSIALHDQMVTRDDLVFCPAVYCYATYAEADHRHPLRFHDLPGPEGCRGSTIGGTGLGVSSHSRHIAEALCYARFAAEASTQRAFALHHGQPAHRLAWEDPEINQRFGGCYRDTRATMDGCWIRPRYDGYLSFQEHGGELVEACLRGVISDSALIEKLERLHSGLA